MSNPEVVVERLAYGGDAIGHLESGKTVFIVGGCPGDKVALNVVEDREKFAKATISEIVEPSSSRTRPVCQYAGLCGGCPWQHVAYGAQLDAKRASVRDALVRIGGFAADEVDCFLAETVRSPKTLGYRNKMEFEVATDPKRGLELGMHAAGGDLMRIDSCPMLPSPFSRAPKALRGALRFLQGNGDLKISRAGVRYSPRTDSAEVALWTEPGPFNRSQVAHTVGDGVMGADVVRVLLKKDKRAKGKDAAARKVTGVEVLSGHGHWTERLGGITYAVSAPSFFQVNSEVAEKMVAHVMDNLTISTESHVADLYSGVGTFTLPIAKLTDHCIAVESEGSSVRDLKRNLTACGLAAEVRGGDVARELPAMGRLDAAVIDPPRTGLATSVVDSLCEACIPHLAYVSCNPTTLARDLKMLCTDVYHIENVTPFDLFPQTFHVETAVILSC